MSYNLITYLLYLLIIICIIGLVGKICYTNGVLFINQIIKNNEALSLKINKTLLVGYYLVNIGYSVSVIANWETVHANIEVLESLTQHVSKILILLAVLHFGNIICISKLLKKSL